jgi:UDP-N-acetylglucosamine acyltransferase
VTIHRGTKPDTKTVVGDECYLMAFSHLAHNVQLGRKVILANAVLLGGYVEVGDGCFFGGGAGVHQFCKIGRLVMVGGNSGLSKDVPPFCMVETVSMNKILGLNTVGMRRGGLGSEERKQIKRAFTLLYRSGLNIPDAARRIREEFESGPAVEMADFIDASERGICGMKSGRGGDEE